MRTSINNVLTLIITTKVSETVRTRATCGAANISLREIFAVIHTETPTIRRKPVSVHLITAIISYCNPQSFLRPTIQQLQTGMAQNMQPPTRETAPVSLTVTVVGIQELPITYRPT
jgi:hypothetical protein